MGWYLQLITATQAIPAIPVTTHAHQVRRANNQGQLLSWPIQKAMMMENVVQGVNALGEFFMLSLGKVIYSREAIMKTCYAFTDHYYVHVVKVADETTGIYFYNKNGDSNEQDISAGVKKFLNSLNENQMRQIIYQETSVLHQEIVRKAFSPAIMLIDAECQDASLNILTSAV